MTKKYLLLSLEDAQRIVQGFPGLVAKQEGELGRALRRLRDDTGADVGEIASELKRVRDSYAQKLGRRLARLVARADHERPPGLVPHTDPQREEFEDWRKRLPSATSERDTVIGWVRFMLGRALPDLAGKAPSELTDAQRARVVTAVDKYGRRAQRDFVGTGGRFFVDAREFLDPREWPRVPQAEKAPHPFAVAIEPGERPVGSYTGLLCLKCPCSRTVWDHQGKAWCRSCGSRTGRSVIRRPPPPDGFVTVPVHLRTLR